LDPNAGTLFDQPIDTDNPDFSFQFTSAGLVRFFCRPHEDLMSGFVDVQTPTDVVPLVGRDRMPGFTDGPAPNPTSDTATFRFALGSSGRVRVEVFDVRGRRVATAVDRTLGAGSYAAAWDGRTAAGERVPAGAYYLRLSGPGVADSREVIVTR
jgi:flagellar hook assembly protein FlgD